LVDLREEQREYLNKLYGFDKPLPVQFWGWISRLFTFDFGESYYRHRTVVGLVLEKLPVSLSLGGWSFLLVYATCIPLGIKKARVSGSPFDAITSVVILFGYSIPGFALGIFLIVLFGGGSFLSWFPLRGLTSDNFDQLTLGAKAVDYAWHLVLPMTCYVIGSFSVMTLLTKNSFLEQISSQYVQVARAKGASEDRVLWGHVFRNAMIPIVLGFPGSFLSVFFGSSLLIETLFSLDGLGLLSYESIVSRDYPVVMATLFFFSLLALVSNLLSDLSLILMDPRISFKSGGN
jgi:microcin C transport system permease protein